MMNGLDAVRGKFAHRGYIDSVQIIYRIPHLLPFVERVGIIAISIIKNIRKMNNKISKY